MAQRGQVFPLKSAGRAAGSWAYRYRTGGRGSHRVQRGGFTSRLAAEQALERALQRLRQEQGLVETPTLTEFVQMYLAQHDAEPETIAKLRWLLSKATAAFGRLPIGELGAGRNRRLGG
jgi:hypothetical protein